MSALRYASAMLALTTIVACTPVQSSAVNGPSPVPETTLAVTNDSHSDVVVYLVRSGMRFRLGKVASLEVKNFVVPPRAIVTAGEVQLVADPIGLTQPHATEPIPISHGAEIAFRVKKQIDNSYYAVLSH